MTVADLIRELQAMPQHMFVRFEAKSGLSLASDGESYSCDHEVRDVKHEGQFILLKGE